MHLFKRILSPPFYLQPSYHSSHSLYQQTILNRMNELEDNNKNMQNLQYINNNIKDLSYQFSQDQFTIYMLQSIRILLQYERDIYQDQYETFQEPTEHEKLQFIQQESQIQEYQETQTLINTCINKMQKQEQQNLFKKLFQIEIFPEQMKRQSTIVQLGNYLQNYKKLQRKNIYSIFRNWSVLIQELSYMGNTYTHDIENLFIEMSKIYKRQKQIDKVNFQSQLRKCKVYNSRILDEIQYDLLKNYKKYNENDIWKCLLTLSTFQRNYNVLNYEIIYKAKKQLQKYLKKVTNPNYIKPGFIISIMQVIVSTRQTYFEQLKENLITILNNKNYFQFNQVSDYQLQKMIVLFSKLNYEDKQMIDIFAKLVQDKLDDFQESYLKMVIFAFCKLQYKNDNFYENVGLKIDLIELSINSSEQKKVLSQQKELDYKLTQFDLDFLRQISIQFVNKS